jgi:TPR repeat protein
MKSCGHTKPDMFEFLRKAADQNVPGALFELGLCYKGGLGTGQNLKEAAKIFKLLSDRGDPAAMIEYAIALKLGAGVKADEAAFRALVQRAMKTDFLDAKLVYAKYLETGDGFPKDLAGAESIYRGLAEQGIPVAEYRLGAFLQSQNRCEEGLQWFRLASDHRHPTAFFSMAMVQVRSAATREVGMENLKIAADAGNARAQYNYALLLEEAGTDRVSVERYYKMASDAGLPNAMCNYASFLSGTDSQTSLRLFREAAVRGHAISAYRYARAIQATEPESAIEFFRIAANAGHAKAQFELALLLEKTAPQESLILLQKSSEAGYAKARRRYGGLIGGPEKAKLRQFVSSEVNPNDANAVFKASCEIQEPIAARAYFEQFLKDDPLFKVRHAQVICRSSPAAGVAAVRGLAESGFPEAKYVYATMLQAGTLTKQNMLLAKKYFQEAAKANHALAICCYGKLIKKQDPVPALELFKRAADLGEDAGEYQYAKMLEMSGVDSEAIAFYARASAKGYTKAVFRYGRAHEVCVRERRNYEIAAKYYEMAATKGHAKAQNNFAHLLELGLGVAQDENRAADLYRLAADAGNSFARHNYARVLERGIGVDRDPRRAAEIYKALAAGELNGLAQFHYARMCHNGIGVEVNFDETKRYYLRAIDNNCAEAKQNYAVLLVTKFHQWSDAAKYFEMAVSGEGAQASAKYDFAQLLLQGMGVDQDMDAAARLFSEAAESFLPAMYSWAQMLEARGDSRAVHFYRKAADSQDFTPAFLAARRNAQYQLGLLYGRGRLVPIDKDESKRYMKMAADNQHPDAESSMADTPKMDLSALLGH